MKKIYFLVFIGITVTSCQSNTEKNNSDQKVVAQAEESLAYKLAVLEKDGYVSKDELTVKRFDNLLEQLDNKYNVNKQQISDMTYKLKEVAGNKGIKVSMIKVMEGATQIGNMTYAEYLGGYLTLIEKGYSHDNTIESLKLRR